MTCIAAISDGQTVWMAGDSLTHFGETAATRSDGKIFRVSGHGIALLMGGAGATHAYDVVRHCVGVRPPFTHAQSP